MPAKPAKINTTTRNALATAQVDGTHVRLTCGQLTPRAYAPVKAILEALGGTWSRSAEATVFPAGSDPAALIAGVLAAGVAPLHPRAAEGFVRTPAALADELLSAHPQLADLPAGAKVLEPSAGDGALVAAIWEQNGGVHVYAVEPNRDRADEVDALAARTGGRVSVYRGTIEEYARRLGELEDTTAGLFDAAIMNPPYALPGESAAWIPHVLAAHALVRQGGHLLAIVPVSYAHHQTRAHRDLRAYVEAAGGWFEPLPPESFAESGTGVRVGVLTIPRPLPARASGLPWWLIEPVQGDPVRVRTPRVTAEAITAAPVQVYADHWQNRERVIRFAALCHGCARPLWEHDDGRQDATGWATCCTLDAEDFGRFGPSVALCMECYNDRDRWNAAHLAVQPHWTDAPAKPATVTVYPLDLAAGLWATVAGTSPLDGRWHTLTGELLADPHYETPAVPVPAPVLTGGGDWWVCLCGNDPAGDGFDPTEQDGWDRRSYACVQCGRTFDQNTGAVTGWQERVAVCLRTTLGGDVVLYLDPAAPVREVDGPGAATAGEVEQAAPVAVDVEPAQLVLPI